MRAGSPFFDREEFSEVLFRVVAEDEGYRRQKVYMCTSFFVANSLEIQVAN